MGGPVTITNKKRGWARSVLPAWVLSFFVAGAAYCMQPPPEPLNIAKLRQLVSEADVIVLGKIVSVRESESARGGERMKTLSAVLGVEKILKGRAFCEKSIIIQETYPNPEYMEAPRAAMPGDKGVPEKGLVVSRAGPSCYHGRYVRGDRIIVLLEEIEGTDAYKPLGSGTYDQHLGEFLMENDGIRAFYFRFAEDLSAYAKSEDEFIDLIRALIDSK